MTERAALGGNLILGGGFAGGFFRRDIAELGMLGHPQRLGP